MRDYLRAVLMLGLVMGSGVGRRLDRAAAMRRR